MVWPSVPTTGEGGLQKKMPLILVIAIVQFCWMYLCNFIIYCPLQLSSNYLWNYFPFFLATAVHCAPTASTTTTSSSSHFSRIVKGRNLIISEKSSVKKNRPNKWKIYGGLRGLISQKKLRQFKLYLVIFCDFFLSSINQYFCLEILSEKVSKFSKKCKKKLDEASIWSWLLIP